MSSHPLGISQHTNRMHECSTYFFSVPRDKSLRSASIEVKSISSLSSSATSRNESPISDIYEHSMTQMFMFVSNLKIIAWAVSPFYMFWWLLALSLIAFRFIDTVLYIPYYSTHPLMKQLAYIKYLKYLSIYQILIISLEEKCV